MCQSPCWDRRGEGAALGAHRKGKAATAQPIKCEPAEKPSRAGPTRAERNAPLLSLSERVNSMWDSGSERESWDLFAAGE